MWPQQPTGDLWRNKNGWLKQGSPRHYFYTSLRLNLGREEIKEAHVKYKGTDDLPGLDVCVCVRDCNSSLGWHGCQPAKSANE